MGSEAGELRGTASGEALRLFEADEGVSDENVTDWCLAYFRRAYGDASITKDDVWEYLYGVMHAPDWRERYRNDLRKSLPRVPLAADFEAFRSAGRELMDLHVGYETCPEADIVVEVGEAQAGAVSDVPTDSPPPPEFLKPLVKQASWRRATRRTWPRLQRIARPQTACLSASRRLHVIPTVRRSLPTAI